MNRRAWVNCANPKRAVSASYDNTLKVWELESGEVLATFTCDASAGCCAYAAALNQIVAGDAGGRVHFLLWCAKTSSEMDVLKTNFLGVWAVVRENCVRELTFGSMLP